MGNRAGTSAQMKVAAAAVAVAVCSPSMTPCVKYTYLVLCKNILDEAVTIIKFTHPNHWVHVF